MAAIQYNTSSFASHGGSFEKFHGAVVDHEGSENTRVFREVADTGNLLERLDDIIGTTKPSDVALIYDIENRWAVEEFKGIKNERKYVETLAEHYAPFWEMGISVDIVDSTKELSQYKLVAAPMLYMLRPGMAEKIGQFVQGGGTFVATYLTGYADEHDLCFLGGFPGPLKKILGIWCEEVDGLYDEERREIRWNGKAYLARDFCEIVHLTGAEQLGEFDEDFYAGSPAVTVNQYGKGTAYYVAARMDEDFQTDFFSKLAHDLELSRPFDAPLPSGCTVQVRTDGVSDFVFIMNFMPYSVVIDVGDGSESMLTGDKLCGETELPERSIEIIRRKSKN